MRLRQREKQLKVFKKVIRLPESKRREIRRSLLTEEKRKELDNALIAAARKGKDKDIERLLKRGADINAKEDIYGKTALSHAVKNDENETVKFLVTHILQLSLGTESTHAFLSDFKACVG